MKTLILGEGASGTAVANQPAVNAKASPFLEGRDVVLFINSNGLTGSPTILVQGSSDGTTYVTLATHTVLYSKQYNIKHYNYMRLGMTVAGGAGTFSAYLNNGV